MASTSLVLRPCSIPMRELVDASPTGSRCRCVAPWLMLPPEFGDDNTVFNFYRTAEGDALRLPAEPQEEQQYTFCLGSSSKGWLVCIQQKDCYLFLFNPLSGKTVPLPSIETFPCVKGVIRNPDSGLVESFLNFQSHPIPSNKFSTYIVKKMALSSPDPMDEDCIAMVIYGPYRRLAFCRRPGIAASWTALDGPLDQYTQIVFHSEKKLFFVFTYNNELEAWDLHNGPVKRFLIHNEYFGSEYWPCHADNDGELEYKSDFCWDTHYLVYDHQSHELFIVTRYTAHAVAPDGTLVMGHPDDTVYPYKTQAFDVFKLDFIDYDHVVLQYMEASLGNRAFFIGRNPGFALSTIMFPELRPNSIYFTDDCTFASINPEPPNFGGHDLGIYDYEDETISPCYYPTDVDKIQRIQPTPVWFTPDVDATCLASTLGF